MRAMTVARDAARSIPARREIDDAAPHWDARLAPLYRSGWRDIQHAEIVLPSKLEGDPRMSWAQNRSLLWSIAEYSDNRPDARIAQGFVEALPANLSTRHRVQVARGFAQALADRHGTAVDFAIHRPHALRSATHVHLFSTAREVTPQGLGQVAMTGARRERDEHRRLWVKHLTHAAHSALLAARLEYLARNETFRQRGGQINVELPRRDLTAENSL